MHKFFAPLLIAIAVPLVQAQAPAPPSPVGVWKTIDDKTKTARAQVRITESDGVFSGKIERLLAADAKQDAVCDKCNDDRKDKPMLGLEIIRGVKKGESENTWDGGTILDAAEGEIYKVRMRLAEGGKKLEVRGYIGAPLFGRTQTWIRAE